jgi:peptidoglycan/xylan/chitin deacetylase (PgdA/CDA1 family)
MANGNFHRLMFPRGRNPAYWRTTPVLLACLWWALSACAPGQLGDFTPGLIKPEIYRSDDYIVYHLDRDIPPSQLALRFLGDNHRTWWIEAANPSSRFEKGEVVIIPLRWNNRGGLTPDGYQTVPVLCYHRFNDRCNSPLCMPADDFDRQMRYLYENGYHVISPEQLRAFLEYRQPLPPKSVWITMDDGYRSVYQVAYPILKKYGFTATLFIYTDFVGVSKTAITWDQLREMKADGFVIGSHTLSHSNLTEPQADESEEAFAARVRKELFESKRIIDAKLKQDTEVFAYPYGYHDHRAIEMAYKAGYRLAVSVKRGGNAFFINPLTVHRDQILKRDMTTFVSRLKTFKKLPLK